jgi:hypothetical protein
LVSKLPKGCRYFKPVGWMAAFCRSRCGQPPDVDSRLHHRDRFAAGLIRFSIPVSAKL